MTMTFDIPADVHARVALIPDLATRIEMFLRHEAVLEALRTQRYGTEARDIAAKAVASALRVHLKEEDRDASFENLRKQHSAVTAQL